jgi:hypothetical protein
MKLRPPERCLRSNRGLDCRPDLRPSPEQGLREFSRVRLSKGVPVRYSVGTRFFTINQRIAFRLIL